MKTLQELRDLNCELLAVNLRLWNYLRDFYERKGLTVPFEPKMEYYVNQALEIVKQINQSPDFEHSNHNPKDEQNR